jgi:hypothetical protein
MGGGGLSWIPIIGPLIDPPKAPEISMPAPAPAPVWEATGDDAQAQATADAAAAKKAATEAEKASLGRKATLLTGAGGDTSAAPVKRKTLLGA